ncbi:MAG: hypothetical protein SFH39_12000 [Candidatus Magnetobacterium sp. LHC-1]|nr:hypothetical protein [Nitrospirota bacterium]
MVAEGVNIKCFVCGAEDKDRVYLECYHEAQKKAVCVHCMPILIHGAH